MQRLTNFVLFGPLLIWLTFMALLSPLIAANGFSGIYEFLFIALLVCYAPGIIPLLALAGVDELMSRQRINVWLRLLVCGAIGFAAALTLFFYFLHAVGAEREFARYGLWLGLMGGVPGALCSWLSNRKQTESVQGVSAA